MFHQLPTNTKPLNKIASRPGYSNLIGDLKIGGLDSVQLNEQTYILQPP